MVLSPTRLAQMVERQTFNLVVMGSSPISVGYFFYPGCCSSGVEQSTAVRSVAGSIPVNSFF